MIGAQAGIKQKGFSSARLDLGRCLVEALDVYKRNPLALVAAVALWQILSVASLMILTGPLTGGMAVLSLRAMRRTDRKVVLRDLFAGFGRFWSLIGLFLLGAIGVACAFGMFVVPGLLVIPLWLYPVFFLVDHDLGILDSIRASWRMVTRRDFWTHLALMGLILIPMLLTHTGFLLAWFLTPMTWLMVASAYRQNEETKPSPIEDWDGF